jgi:hypothetical protein
MSEKKKKNVPTVEAQKADPDSSKVLPQEPPKEATVEAAAPTMPFDLSKVDPKKIELAEEMGIPIKQLINWAASVEVRFGAISKNLEEAPQKVVAALKAEAVKRQTEAVQQTQQGGEPRKGGGMGLGDLVALAKEAGLTGGGGGMDEEMLKLTKEMMHMNIDRMRQDMGFTDAIKNAIVTKIASKAVTEII